MAQLTRALSHGENCAHCIVKSSPSYSANGCQTPDAEMHVNDDSDTLKPMILICFTYRVYDIHKKHTFAHKRQSSSGCTSVVLASGREGPSYSDAGSGLSQSRLTQVVGPCMVLGAKNSQPRLYPVMQGAIHKWCTAHSKFPIQRTIWAPRVPHGAIRKPGWKIAKTQSQGTNLLGKFSHNPLEPSQ